MFSDCNSHSDMIVTVFFWNMRSLVMDVNKISDIYYVRKLDKDDVGMIYELSYQNHIFYEYHPPFVTKESIFEDMEALPPGKSYEDKYYIGFFEDNYLVALMDLITDYPDQNTAFIGLFMTDIHCQNKGIGSMIINDTSAYLKTLGYRKIRLGVDKGNPQSYAFWIKNSFEVISDERYIVMERII